MSNILFYVFPVLQERSAPVASKVRTLPDFLPSFYLPLGRPEMTPHFCAAATKSEEWRATIQHWDIIGGKRIYFIVIKTMKINFDDKIKVLSKFCQCCKLKFL